MERDPDEWSLNLEGLQICTIKFDLKDNIPDNDFMIHVINNFPEEYIVIFDGLENCLTVTRHDAVTINVIHKN